MKLLAHVSDLHLDLSSGTERQAAQVVEALRAARVDHVVVTGDVTHAGRRAEYARFLGAFEPLWAEGRLTVVPGNHDRCGDDVAALISQGRRVAIEHHDDLFVVKVDSTAPHNRISFRSHGEVCRRTLEAVDEALAQAPTGTLVALALHHHVLPLPVESVQEWFDDAVGWPHAAELHLGRELLHLARGRCDLVLHGHRHVPRALSISGDGERSLRVYNAGATGRLGAFRVFAHEHGQLAREPEWRTVRAPPPRATPVPRHERPETAHL
jgi:3',5'-cyclic AMP phosphodiesterase CpdA